MRIRFLFYFIILGNTVFFGQSLRQNQPIARQNLSEYHIDWQGIATTRLSDTDIKHFLNFKGAEFSFQDNFLPRCFQGIPVNSTVQSFTASIINASYEPLSDAEAAIIKNPSTIPAQIQLEATVVFHQKKPSGVVSFIPIRKNNLTGKFEKLINYDLDIVPQESGRSSLKSLHTYASHSVLQSGNWYKIAIGTSGIYKVTYAFLQGLGIDMTTIVPQNIRIYGNGGGMLPALNSVSRPDDLVEDAIYVSDSDGVFNANDYILFYGKGPNTWKYTGSACAPFKHSTHLYSDSAYYFITTDLGPGKRIQIQASSSLPPTNTVNTFNDYLYHENDDINFIKSGNQWFGEYFENIASYNFSFLFPNVDETAVATINTSMASRYIGGGSAGYSISCQTGSTILNIPATVDDPEGEYALIRSGCFSFNPSSSSFLVNVTKQTSDAVAWLDYIEVNTRRKLIMSGNQMEFRDAQSVGAGNIAQYNLTSSFPLKIWDVTDPTTPYLQSVTIAGINYQYELPADTLRQFIAFTGASYNVPRACGSVPNQDLHGISSKQFLIICHPDFLNEAQQLANYHQTVDTISTVIVTPQQIYNEFSSGAQDVIAIRQFVKMFYDRATTTAELPKYLLLFGDGSYDNKKRFSSNTNFIPTYESDNSTVVTASYVSDDYYGLLDDNEGVFSPFSVADVVDIGIGRFPVQTRSEAQATINKIFNYTKVGLPASTVASGCSNNLEGSPFGDWRNMLCFIADDEDSDLHISEADELADTADARFNSYNIDKIYLDAYRQESTPGGQRYPGVSDAIDKRVEKGALIINYTGHGGPVGLAHERVVEVAQINKWNNFNSLPLFFTATCEFSRFDDPERTSAGEYVFLNPGGGAIALFTTVRLVYAPPNFALNQHFYNAAFSPIDGRMPRLGDLFEYIKSKPGGNIVNSRNFTLLGDPALRLSYPKYDVATDTVNNNIVTAGSSDTLKALSLVTISGHLRDKSGVLLNTYNGVLYPTVYDKAQNFTTLSNDGSASPPFPFKLQKNVLYKGKVSVTNGVFKFSFVVPKDIAYQFGFGRISYYAENGTLDANGFYEKVIIGGSNNSALTDNIGPDIKLYLNDAKFVYGGLTDENPDLFAMVKDENGVNTVGNGIGHDITAVLDANTENSIVLNDYYQADLNSYKSGTIRYPFSSLSEGQHSLSLKVWDVYNNSSQSFTQFVVSKSAELALSHVLNYPNPFSTRTQFYFEHNKCCQTLNVEVQVFTVSGKLVKNISRFVQAEGYRSDPIEWDGRDDFGDKIGRGVYIYRIRVKTTDGETAEKYEKLVILN